MQCQIRQHQTGWYKIKSMQAHLVIPVWLFMTCNPKQKFLVYALLDNQSDTTFILQEKAKALATRNEFVQLKLSILTSKVMIISNQRLGVFIPQIQYIFLQPFKEILFLPT